MKCSVCKGTGNQNGKGSCAHCGSSEQEPPAHCRHVIAHSNSLVDGKRNGYLFGKLVFTEQGVRIDPGPSPAGNCGPYLHVPHQNGYSVHRVYPRLARGDSHAHGGIKRDVVGVRPEFTVGQWWWVYIFKEAWGEDHQQEAFRRSYEIAAELVDVENSKNGGPWLASQAFGNIRSEAGWRTLLGSGGLGPKRIDREVKHVRDLAEGRKVRERGWRVVGTWYDRSNPDDCRIIDARRYAAPEHVIAVTRYRRVP